MNRRRPESAPARRAVPARCRPGSWPVLAAVVLALAGAPARRLAADAVPHGTITDIRIVGNRSVPAEEIRRKIVSKVGRELDPATVEADLKSLLESKWFSDVQTSYTKDPGRPDGIVLIFTVREMPVLRAVEFRGATKIKLKELEDSTGLKAGGRADHLRAMLAVNQVKRLYEEKGYLMAEVQLLEGGKPGDTKVVFQIFEGPKCRVTSIRFTGNTVVSDAKLATKLTTRKPILGLGGHYTREDLEEDARKLREYYQSMGYFESKVSVATRAGVAVGDIEVEFTVWEGVQYQVRDIRFDGNKLVPTDRLKQGLVMHSGQPFSDELREADRKTLESKYGELGCIDAYIEVERRYADPEKKPGVIDLVYHIHEGEPYLLGHLIIRGNARTRDRVLRREAEMAGLVPGESLNAKHIELYKKRLTQLRYFVADPQMGKPIEVQLVNRRPANQPYGEVRRIDVEDVVQTRLQDPGPEASPPVAAPAPRGPIGGVEPLAPGPGPAGVVPFTAGGPFDPPPDQPVPPIAVPVPPASAPAAGPIQPPPFTGELPPLPVGAGEPPGTFPTQPGMNANAVGPEVGQPFPDRSWADIVTNVEEAPTGRVMFGVGATSYGGLNGNFILHESNFDITAFPRSWRELFSGQAFRGAGQDFQIQLSPGTQINRSLISFRDPYFLNLPGGYAIGLNLSGYLFDRWYPGQFDETRGGGRFSLGSQFGTSTYADVAVRVENVRLYGFSLPAPADYLAADGNTFLATIRPSIRFDNRNDPFAPNKGQYLEAAFEQGWGTFTFPKFTAEGRKYFTLGSRPDGTGKRILTFRGFFGIAGRDTPVYERFYAGDFRSMRGFQYRGVGPFVMGRNVGGILTAIGSVEYQFPWIASDKLQQVVFCDFGTVESGYEFTTFRAAVGTGLRIFLPQQMFGPLPLAFDLGFPVVKGPEDRTKIFTFFIGAFW